MKNRPGSNGIVTEWEDNILFDPDDPDFCNQTQNPPSVVVNAGGQLAPFTFRVSTNMSIASVHQPQINDMYSPLGRSSISMSSSLSDLVGSPLEISMDNVLTIEELRAHMGSCFTCGVSWTDDHVSLDCGECGGYSLERPCPLCDGQCGVQWKRDFTMSHACSKARWQGVCPSYPEALLSAPTMVPSVTAASCAASNQLRLAQELCARLEQLSASAHT